MKTPDTSSPAFPGLYSTPGYGCARRTADGELEEHTTGMTLRDYFAAKALQGMMANNNVALVDCLTGSPEDIQAIAKTAYALSDAMLAQREKLG